MAVNAGGVYVDLGLNSARFQDGLKGAGRQLDKFGKDAGKISGTLRGAFAGIGDGLKLAVGGLGIGALFAGARSAAADLAQMNSEAQKAGLGVEAFQRLGYAAQGALVNIDAVTDGLKEMQLRADEYVVTGQGSAAEAFKRLGLSVDDVKKQLNDPEAFFQTIIDQLATLDKASQIRIADEIFGGTGGEQFVRFLSQGVGYIKRMGQEAEATGNVLSAELVQRAVEIDRAFAKLSTTVGTNLKGALVGVVSLMRDFTDMLNSTEAQSAGTLQRRIDLLKAAAENMRNSSLAFAVGGGDEGVARREAEAAALQKQLDGKPATSITLNKPASGGMGDLSKVGTSAQAANELARAHDQIVLSAEQRIAQMATEQQALGLTTAEAEALRVKQELLNEAQRAGIDLTAAQSAKLEELAAKSGQAAAALEATRNSQAQAAAAMQQWESISLDAVSGFVSDLRNGVEAADALENSLNRVLDTLIEMVLQEAIKGIFSSLSGSSGGGNAGGSAGSGLGGLIGSFIGGLFGFARGGVVEAATGGSIRGAGTGTSDSIPALLSNGEYVVNAKQAAKNRALLEAINSGTIGKFAAGGLVAPSLPSISRTALSAGSRGGAAVAPQLNVQVNTLPGTTADVQQRPDGGVQIDIRRLVRSEVERGFSDGAFDRAGQARYGWRRQTV